MIKLNIHETHTLLPRYLDRLSAGETILLCRRDVPVAEIRPIASRSEASCPLDLAKERFQIQDTFFEPSPDDRLNAFDGWGNEPDR